MAGAGQVADPAKISDKTVALTIGIQPEWS
jgi:hypothetical protein